MNSARYFSLLLTVLTLGSWTVSASGQYPASASYPVQQAQGTTLGGVQAFDPYATGGSTAYGSALNTPAYGGTPLVQQPPIQPQPLLSGQGAPYSQPQYGATQPASLFPNGLNGTGQFGSNTGPYLRLFNRPGAEYTWLGGGSKNELDVNDFDVNVTAAIPNFLWGQQPLFVTPGFRLSLWQGPTTPPFADAVGQDMPGKAYSAYLTFQWNPRLQNMPHLGADLSVEPGIHSDFNALTLTGATRSFRVQGMGLGHVQLTETVALKLGVAYLDRARIKLLPAGGIVWTPNGHTELNILFPNPKLRWYLTRIRNADLWWYLAGEYGGGSWSIEHPAPGNPNDRVDVNDIRVSAGLEWIGTANAKFYVELGYVFDRELVFVSPPEGVFVHELDSTFMLRGGFHF